KKPSCRTQKEISALRAAILRPPQTVTLTREGGRGRETVHAWLLEPAVKSFMPLLRYAAYFPSNGLKKAVCRARFF
ncbi:hypothetical protein, partial [Treponema sp. OMZ 805]|uniref:hypothetical protein n=1 Tax=Treponema sp. OMZ 805 TaxID=2726068 RepID=UPI003D8A9013